MSIQDAGETSTETKTIPENAFSRLPRVMALIAMLLGAGGSFGLMLYAARGQRSILLMALFTAWVLAPFFGLTCAYVASKGWAAPMPRALYRVILFVTAGSLAIYGNVALGTLRAKSGFIFLVVPAGTWLLIAIALGRTALKSR
jgi:hypothetical protein